MQVFVTFDDKHNMAVDAKVIKTLFPAEYKAAQGNVVHIKTGLEHVVTAHHVEVLYDVYRTKLILPMKHVRSHRDVYIIVTLAEHIGINYDKLMKSFLGFAANRRWVELENAEYLLLLRNAMEELVDMKSYFTTVKDPFKCLAHITAVPEYRANPAALIDALLYYKQLKFETLFAANNRDITSKVEALNASRAKAWRHFLVDPHADYMREYFVHVPVNDNVWSCNGISATAAPAPGDQVVVPLETALERFHEFTRQMFLKAPNPNARDPFPFGRVAFAGGSTTKILGTDYDPKNARQSDCDIFIFAETVDERAEVYEKVMRWFDTPNTYYALRGSVTTIYIKDISRKFQVISINASNPYDVIARFDLTHIQWMLVGDTNGPNASWQPHFYGTPEACRAMREKITRFSNTARVRIHRLIKALHCGYSVSRDTDVVDISDIIGDKALLEKQIRELYGWYYPTSHPDMSREDEERHILRMIEQDSDAALVHNNLNVILDNVTISGNFEIDYDGVTFQNFNTSMLIIPRNIGRNSAHKTVKTKNGTLKVMSSSLEVTNVRVGDAGVDVTIKVDNGEFSEFIKTLEGPVYRLYAGNRAINKRIVEDGRIKFNVNRRALDAQVTRGISKLRSQRGVPLNIEEDLQAGDRVQILFLVTVDLTQDRRGITLVPLRFIKYCKYDPVEDERLKKEDAAIERDAAAAETITFDASITYEDAPI